MRDTHVRGGCEPSALNEHLEVVHRRAAPDPGVPERMKGTEDARAVRGKEAEWTIPERGVLALHTLEVRVHAEAARPRLDLARLGREVRRGGEEAPLWLQASERAAEGGSRASSCWQWI